MLSDSAVLSEDIASLVSSENFPLTGSALDLGDEASRVPVLLIQNPGYQAAVPAGAGQQRRGAGTRPPSGGREGLGCGWDVVLPARWAMAFWVPLVYR